MEDKFITIKEASLLSGKSEFFVRRRVKEIYSQQASPTLSDNPPSLSDTPPTTPQQAIVKMERQTQNPNSPFVFLIQKEFAIKEFGVLQQASDRLSDSPPDTPPIATATTPPPIADDYIATLKEQLKVKDETIKALLHTNREQSFLLLRLQAPQSREEPKPEGKPESIIREAETGETGENL